MMCPICGAQLQYQVDDGDPEAGYAGGEERFRCLNAACELGGEWLDEGEVQAAVDALATAHGGHAA